MSDEIVDIEAARLKMKKWREEGDRNSEEIIEYGECLILEYTNKLGDEIWTIYEQVLVAALDCNRVDLAEECLMALQKKFPSSRRVLKLKGMYYESRGQYGKAENLYNTMLEKDPANLVIRKRFIAMKKAQNNIDEATEELNKYLKDFMGDQEAWMELCELYIQQQEYSKAAFCMEELILSHPHNHLYHQRYAEIQFTIGTSDSLEKSKKYFAQALKLDPNNVRALYGLFLTSVNTASGKSATNTKRKNINFSQWTATQVMEMFDVNVSENQRKTLTEMFDNMQLSIPSNVPE